MSSIVMVAIAKFVFHGNAFRTLIFLGHLYNSLTKH